LGDYSVGSRYAQIRGSFGSGEGPSFVTRKETACSRISMPRPTGRREIFAFDERVAACCRDEQQVPFGGALISSALLRLIRLARDRASRVFGVRRRLVLRTAAAEVGLIGLALDRRNVAPDPVLAVTA
jgi:hypothetical protein